MSCTQFLACKPSTIIFYLLVKFESNNQQLIERFGCLDERANLICYIPFMLQTNKNTYIDCNWQQVNSRFQTHYYPLFEKAFSICKSTVYLA